MRAAANMNRILLGPWLIAIGLASAAPAAVAGDDPGAELAALGAHLARNAAGETIGVDLGDAWVTDEDLAKLARLPRLEVIRLASTKITDLGLEHLAPLEGVLILDLEHAEAVTDQGIAYLKHWRRLEQLNLRGTKVT